MLLKIANESFMLYKRAAKNPLTPERVAYMKNWYEKNKSTMMQKAKDSGYANQKAHAKRTYQLGGGDAPTSAGRTNGLKNQPIDMNDIKHTSVTDFSDAIDGVSRKGYGGGIRGVRLG